MTEQKLKSAEKEIKDLNYALDQSSIVAFTDVAGTITSVNDKFCEISKYSREELIGKNHRIINSRHHSKEFFIQLWHTISVGKVWKGEIKNQAKDGSYYWVFTTIVPFLNDKGKPYKYVAIRTDITDLKFVEEQLERERTALIHAEKMASLGEMASGIAHELGNPLATIAGRMEFLGMQVDQNGADAETVKKVIKTVTDLTDRMTRIMRGMRSLARNGAQDPFQRASIGRMIRDILELSSEKFKKMGTRVETSEIREELEIRCRETQISQVFVNLINNARDAVQDLQERWIKIEVLDRPDSIEISIMDSGKGISAEIREKIMLPFFSTKDVGKGMGLGLSICKSIVEQHGGSITLDPISPNTRFVVRLPKTHE